MHLQEYIEYNRPVRLGGCKRDIPGAHFEPRAGTAQQTADYCKKNGDVWEHDEMRGSPSKRTDLDRAKELLDSGADEKKIADECFGAWCRFEKSFTKYRRMTLPVKDWVMDVRILYGPTEVGKSREAIGENPECFI